MNDFETEKPKAVEQQADSVGDPGDQPFEATPLRPGLRERVWKFLNNAQRRRPVTKQALAKDRTRPLALLICGTVGAVLLFLGVFSTPSTQLTGERGGDRAVPNLGRRLGQNQTPTGPRGSVTPLLNADVASGDAGTDVLSAADIHGTSRRTSDQQEQLRPDEVPANRRVGSAKPPQTRSFSGSGVSSPSLTDPVGAYRLNITGAPTYSHGAPAPSTTNGDSPRPFTYGGATPLPTVNRMDAGTSSKSSIVYVRSSESKDLSSRASPSVTASSESISLLAPGTRLVARLEAAATTAVKLPVVGSIEYNYERDGIIVVPAGTKVVGDVQQSSPQGYVSIRFHTLQMPDGREEKIEGAGMGFDQKPLKGDVSGKNTGKKFVSRTLSGVGTIAAYVLGAGGSGLTRTVTGETLLRDRVASNIALAGEQELTNAAYSQNISVTVPANTPFYVVLQKPAINTTSSAARSVDTALRPAEIPTVQELRELMDLRREINRMYQESNPNLAAGTKP